MLRLMVIVGGLVATAGPEHVTPADWIPMIRRGALEQARAVCEGWLRSADAQTLAEAHKCLANVELAPGVHERVYLGEESGADDVDLSPFCSRKEALLALGHLEQAVRLAPQDLSIHQGRLHVLELAGLYERMPPALEQSAQAYHGADALEAWLAYPDELVERRQNGAAEPLLLVLEKRYPGDPRVARRLVALYEAQKRYVEALRWARHAVKAAPADPEDLRTLARIRDHLRAAPAAPVHEAAPARR